MDEESVFTTLDKERSMSMYQFPESAPATDFIVACNVVDKYLLRYTEEALSPRSRMIIQSHLDECERCWDKLTLLIEQDVHILYHTPRSNVGGYIGIGHGEDATFASDIFVREADHAIVLFLTVKQDIDVLQRHSIGVSISVACAMRDELEQIGWQWEPNGPELVSTDKLIGKKGQLVVNLATWSLLDMQMAEHRLLLEKVTRKIMLQSFESEN